MENYIKTRDFYNRRYKSKMIKTITRFLKYKGLKADEFVFTTKLFKEPEYFIAGFKIAIQREKFMNRNRIYFSLIK